MVMRRTFLAAATALFLGAGGAFAQAFPEKPVRIIVPYSAGTATDTLARLVAQKLSEKWGQQAVVENITGANGMIGTDVVAKAPKDGHTLAMIAANHAVSTHIFPNVPYDPVKDFAAIGIIGQVPFVLAVHPSVPVQTAQELAERARANPGKLNYASAGNGSPPHLSGELFKSMAKVDVVHVPYKGLAPAITDLLGGQVHFAFGATSAMLPHVRNGKLRALGVTSLKRTSAAPELATLDEQGFKGFEVVSWVGLVGPTGMPATVVSRLNTDVTSILSSPEMKTRIAGLGIELVAGSVKDMEHTLANDFERWGRIVKASGAKID
jgi:tripartite-type tricarboxylate transporter receptor subunit TctC